MHSCSCPWVHPRSRGATSEGSNEAEQMRGPSPLTRGNLSMAAAVISLHGSIPAHAGQQPVVIGVNRSVDEVHPRSRGATTFAYCSSSHSMGPSPLTRGNLVHLQATGAPDGSIPAHAGQPPASPYAPTRPGVHPRSRGATVVNCALVTTDEGPSPLTRGNRAVDPADGAGRGSIPAHAGQPPWH